MAEAGISSPSTESRVRRRPSSKKIMLGIVVAILLGIFLPPLVNVNRYRTRIASSISSAVGRPATVGGVELRLLPQPGFDLHNVEIGDDPTINAEYLLHADEVTAYLRLSSLWRGRLEVARLTLTDPSLNVVRSSDGRWNLETLLSRTTQIPSAPTAQAHPEVARHRFPYIEATGGRINFKFGLEKKAFTFTDSDFALWLASENNWNMRLEARPYRVDTKVTDTGSLKMEASFQRNSTLRYTPVKFSVSWREGQLGQVSKLLSGRDHGWRGQTSLALTGSGTPANLAVIGDLRVDDFRRYDIASGGAMRLKAHCAGNYIAAEEKLTSLQCQSPVGDGSLALSGTVQRLGEPFFNLKVSGEKVPLSSAMALVRHAKRDLPEDLSANGTTDFAFTARKALDFDAKTLWSGGGTSNDLVLRSQALGPDLTIGNVNFVIAPEAVSKPKTPRGKVERTPPPPQPQEIDTFRLAVAPFPIDLGAADPTQALAVVTNDGFTIGLAGDTDLARTLQVARALGIETPRVSAKGAAKLDLKVVGRWTGFEAPQLTGTAQLKNVVAEVPGVIEPVQVVGATVALDEKALRFQNVAASFTKGPSLTGTVAMSRNCQAGPCPMEFTVHADELSPERLNQLLNPKFRNRPWYNFFMPHPSGDKNPLAALSAAGQFTIDRWSMDGTVATHASGSAQIEDERISITALRADLLGGQHTGEWTADFSGNKPVFSGKGKLTRANMAGVAVAMEDAWITGTFDVDYQLKLTGQSADELRSSASGVGEFSLKDGTLRRMGLDAKAGALKVAKFDGNMELRDGKFYFTDAKLQSGGVVYTVQGTASWTRELDFKIADSQHTFALTGTIKTPEIKQAPATEAALQSKQ